MDKNKGEERIERLEDLLFNAVFCVLDDRLRGYDQSVYISLPGLIDSYIKVHEINKNNHNK